jgi:uncharacterized membrane protein (DUF373 family)
LNIKRLKVVDKQDKSKNLHYEELPSEHHDPLIEFLNKTIKFAVKILAVLMVLVIIWGIGDVIYVLYKRLMLPPVFLLSISDILATFGAFLAVLIAIEIFINITIYIRNDVLPVKLVVATALMAISRKVIILTLKSLLQCIFSQQRLLYWHLELHIG